MTGWYSVWSVESTTDERAVAIVIRLSARGLHWFQGLVVGEIGEPRILETVFLDAGGDVFKDESVLMGRHIESKAVLC